MKTTISGLAAFALIATSSVAIAQENPLNLDPAAMTSSFVERLGMIEVLPNFYITAQQMAELEKTQCTGGPTGLFNELRAKIRKDGGNWCSRENNSRLGGYFKSGAVGYTLMAGPTSARLTVYDQAVNQNRNVRCLADIPYSGVFELKFSCFDAKSGAQIKSEIIGQILGSAIPMMGAAVVSNLTAPRAGNTNISVGNQSASNSGANAEAAGAGGAPVHIYNNPSATAGAAVLFNEYGPNCPTGVCK